MPKGVSSRKRARSGKPELKIFLSHSSKDREDAAAIHSYLADHGLDVWYSTHRITAGSWMKDIHKALETCNVFLLLSSPHAVRSVWVGRELNYALNHSDYNDRIIVAELARADIEKLTWALAGEQILALHPDLRQRLPRLLRALRRFG